MSDNEKVIARKVLQMEHAVEVSFLLRFSVAGSRFACL